MLLSFIFTLSFSQFRTSGPITTDGLLNVTGVILSIVATYFLATRQFKAQNKLTQSNLINNERPYFNIDSIGNTINFSFYNKSNSIINFLEIYVEQIPASRNRFGEKTHSDESTVPVYIKYSLGHSLFNTPITQTLGGKLTSCIIECTTLSNERIVFFYLDKKTSSLHRILEPVDYSSESATHRFLKNDISAQKDYNEFMSNFK